MHFVAAALLRGVTFALAITPFGLVASAQEPEPPRAPRPHRGPWNNDLLLFQSADGQKFGESRMFVERGGVPCVVRDARDRLLAVFQWFPFDRQEAFDKVAVVISEDEGKTWTKPQPITVRDLPEGAQRPFDPTLVLLEDNRLRLYFTCSTPERRTPGIYSAISENGVDFTFEPGMRLGVEGQRVVDPAVARLGKTWHLFSPIIRGREQGGPEERPERAADTRGYHAVSDDGLTFRRVDDVSVPIRGDWIGNVIVSGDQLHFYGSGAERGWLATSANGNEWKLLTTSLGVGGDPAPIKLKDGSHIVIATGPPRRDIQDPPFRPKPQPASPAPPTPPTPRRVQ